MRCSVLRLKYDLDSLIFFDLKEEKHHIKQILLVSLQEILPFQSYLLESKEPLLTLDWNETNVKLPFEGFTKAAFPKVNFQQFQLIPNYDT